eukprot:CAMPEP_0195573350 /NCGR_PEP_ID=MMETSP0814-20130614/5288_1 /TAXON_ID=97485 /ORGANISM="Prymnesium parvum, Strain Texoma1" /LENGTH=143 /DNA_ID=CAMNT_0040709221 /DNA_START=230 /DNA_END=662 /DNA_ORIENTATION=-
MDEMVHFDVDFMCVLCDLNRSIARSALALKGSSRVEVPRSLTLKGGRVLHKREALIVESVEAVLVHRRVSWREDAASQCAVATHQARQANRCGQADVFDMAVSPGVPYTTSEEEILSFRRSLAVGKDTSSVCSMKTASRSAGP